MTAKNNDNLTTVEQLRSQLIMVDEKKENFFSEKRKWDERIVELLQKAKTLKQSRDEKTSTVQQLKEQRKTLATTLKDKISVVKKLPFFRKQKKKETPSSLKAKIERLERTIETEVMPFEKEKKLTAQIKTLKRQYSELSVEEPLVERKTLNQEIKMLRKEADVLHHKVQETAKKSQEAHEELLQTFSGLDEARKKQKEFFEQFAQAKQEFQRLHAILKKKTDGRGQIGGSGVTPHQRAARGQKLSKLVQSVEEKIKKGKKLTTEDLLAFQTTK